MYWFTPKFPSWMTPPQRKYIELFTASLTSTDQSVQISDGTAVVHILDNDSEPYYNYIRTVHVCMTGKLS